MGPGVGLTCRSKPGRGSPAFSKRRGGDVIFGGGKKFTVSEPFPEFVDFASKIAIFTAKIS